MTPPHPPPRAAADAFAGRLLRWFDRHGRKSLPWQHSRDPYRIWVAEIMLQQTRVATVIPYFRRFMARFPDIAALARCDPDELLHCWSGLGYYARARNLRAAAQQIVARHGGRFPDRFDEVLALPGIGRSTAGAILAFAFGQRHPILDGNVRRVLARCFAVAGPTTGAGAAKVQARLWEIADRLTPGARVGDYNQALMDLGATVCLRAKPRCAQCPLMTECAALAGGDPGAFPTPKPKTARRRRAVTMLVVRNPRAELLLVKRPPAGIWGGLWSLPEYADGDGGGDVEDDEDGNADGDGNADKKSRDRRRGARPIEIWFERQFGLVVETGRPLPLVRHSFTHFDLDIRPLPATLPATQTQAGAGVMDAGEYLWYNPLRPAQVGLPTAVKRILEMLEDAGGVE